jgi:hypothetical protein
VTSDMRVSARHPFRETEVVRIMCALAVTACALFASALFLIVLVTKATVLDDDAWARVGLIFWFVTSSVLAVGARAAWRRPVG